MRINKSLTSEIEGWLYEKVEVIMFHGPVSFEGYLGRSQLWGPLRWTPYIKFKMKWMSCGDVEIREKSALKQMKRFVERIIGAEEGNDDNSGQLVWDNNKLFKLEYSSWSIEVDMTSKITWNMSWDEPEGFDGHLATEITPFLLAKSK